MSKITHCDRISLVEKIVSWRILVIVIPKSLLSAFLVLVFSGFSVFGQITQVVEKPKEENKTEKKNEKKVDDKNLIPQQAITGEQVAESTILVYGGFRGRDTLNQVRKTTIERGKVVQNNPDGTVNNATYERRIIRGESLYQDKIRLDQKFSNTDFAMIYTDSKIFGIFGETVFTPKKEAIVAFQNQIWRGIEGLLRYKESGSKVDFVGKEKQMGVEYYLVDVTDKDQRKTRFFVSTKLVRIAAIEYTEDSIKYTRKFYNFNYAQGTLVPSRSTLYANGKQIEETNVSTITYGQKLDEGFFAES
jgi:hypothetical protein